MSMTAEKSVNVLLVEDDALDAFLTKKYLRQMGFDLNVYHVEDGESALKVMKRKPGFTHIPTPDLILLDINLPRKTGVEVLEEMKKDPELKKIQVIIITGLDLHKGPMVHDFNLMENSIVRKWVSMKDFVTMVKAVEDYIKNR